MTYILVTGVSFVFTYHDRPRSLCWATLNPNMDPPGPWYLIQFLTSTLNPSTAVQHSAANSRARTGLRDDGGVISIRYGRPRVVIIHCGTRLTSEH